MWVLLFLVFFCKQRADYEMRISGGSSNWCSSDLALVRDTANNVYIDPAKVREINHRGKYFKVRGPLNQVPSPQGKPVLMQAGASPRGRDFAARHADAVFAPPIGGLEGMKAIRDDIKARAVKFGRSEEHTSELQSLMRISYAVFCLKKQNT